MIEIIIDRMNHTRSCILGAYTITSSVNFRSIFLSIEHCLNILVKWFAETSRFLCSVKNCNSLNCSWKNVHKIFFNKRSVKSYFDKTYSVTLCHHFVHCFFYCFTYGTHSHDDIFSIRCSNIVKWLIASSCHFADFIHIFNNNFRNSIIEFI